MTMKRTLAAFGRRSPSMRPRVLGMLGADPSTPPAGPACGFGDFLGDAPIDTTTQKPSTIGNGVREGVKFALLLAGGAIVGAVVSPQKRARNAAIGGAVGAVAGAGVVYMQYGTWKDDGGVKKVKGACDGTAKPGGQQAPSQGPSKGPSGPPKGNAPGAPPPALPPPAPPVRTQPPAPPAQQTQPPPAAPTFTPGAWCSTPDGQTTGVYDANGNCVQASAYPGDDCTLSTGATGYYDSSMTCVAYATPTLA